MGLARSILCGVTDLQSLRTHIVVEDDLVTSRYFLSYMNQGLITYQHHERVVCIHGYVYPSTTKLPETFLCEGADCWGWATWSRGWRLFESDGQKLLDALQERGLNKDFNLDDSIDYVGMLRSQIAGKNDSWAIRWHASAYLADALTLYPGQSLVNNIGFDGSGTHAGNTPDMFSVNIGDKDIQVKRYLSKKVKWPKCIRPTLQNMTSPDSVGEMSLPNWTPPCIFHWQSRRSIVHAAPNASQRAQMKRYEVPLATFRRRNDRSRTYSLVICSFQASPLRARWPVRRFIESSLWRARKSRSGVAG